MQNKSVERKDLMAGKKTRVGWREWRLMNIPFVRILLGFSYFFLYDYYRLCCYYLVIIIGVNIILITIIIVFVIVIIIIITL